MSNINNQIWILHLVNTLDVGGDSTFLMNYLRNIDTDKIRFAFVVQRNETLLYDDEVLRLNGRIHKVRSMSEDLFGYYKDLKKIILQHPEYRIVHSHMNHKNAIPLLLCKFNGIKHRISHAHARGTTQHGLKGIRIILMKCAIRILATNYFACSSAAGRYLYGKKRIFVVIPNAVNSKLYSFSNEKRILIRKELNINEQFVIGHIGNFSRLKNYKFIIDTFYYMPENSLLILVGSGELDNEIKEYVFGRSLANRVKFLGLRNDVPNLLQGFDAFIFPSISEGMGFVAIEAQCSSLPTYCSLGVPKEVAITNYAHHISLEHGPLAWSELIKKGIGTERIDVSCDIQKSGYDIRDASIDLMDIYNAILFSSKRNKTIVE